LEFGTAGPKKEPLSLSKEGSEYLRPEVFIEDEIQILSLTPEEFLKKIVVKRTLRRQDIIVFSLLFMLAVSLLATIGLFYLKGLGLINLNDSLLHWIGGATIGELAILLTLCIKSVFPNFTPSR
jgi:hypothetical protein